MRLTAIVAAALATAALPALAAPGDGPRLYPVPSAANYCPAGLQPITIDGSICCGQPNTHVTWYEMKRHPVRRARYTPADACPEGQKGCD